MTAKSDDSAIETDKQIQFARHNFDNLQSLIRFTDTKSGALVTVVIFLGATGIQVTRDAVGSMHFCSVHSIALSALFSCGCLGFLIFFSRMVISVERVLRPRGARHYASTEAGGDLMWQDHVVRYSTSTAYFESVAATSTELILRNITDQVFELCHISKEKTDAFHEARACFRAVFFFWVLTIVCGILIVRWK